MSSKRLSGDLDELHFAATLPVLAKKFVDGLAPLRYWKPSFFLDAIVPLALTFATVVVCYLALVLPIIQDMILVKQALCGGNLDFVVAVNPAGFPVGRRTPPFSGGEVGITGAKDRAIQELREAEMGGTLQYSYFATTPAMFQSWSQQTLLDLGDISTCDDLDVYNNGRDLENFPVFFTAIREATGLHSGSSMTEQIWRCADHARFCDTDGLLRNRCPITCGCADPRSGLALSQHSHGCPPACANRVSQLVANMSCVDLDVANTPAWARYWNSYQAAVLKMFPEAPYEFHDFVRRKIASGCNDTAPDPFLGEHLCDESSPIVRGGGFGTIYAFCPAQCCNRPGHNPNCPAACH